MQCVRKMAVHTTTTRFSTAKYTSTSLRPHNLFIEDPCQYFPKSFFLIFNVVVFHDDPPPNSVQIFQKMSDQHLDHEIFFLRKDCGLYFSLFQTSACPNVGHGIKLSLNGISAAALSLMTQIQVPYVLVHTYDLITGLLHAAKQISQPMIQLPTSHCHHVKT